MQQLKMFIRSLFLSSTSPRYYAAVLAAKFSFSLKFLAGLQLFSTLFVLSLILIPLSQVNPVQVLDSVQAIYPRNLEIRVEDGRVQINQPLPYRVPLPGGAVEVVQPSGANTLRYLVVFTSNEALTGANDVFAQQAAMVVTESSFYILEQEGQGFRVYPIPSGERFAISPDQVNQVFQRIKESPFVQNRLYLPLLGLLFFVVVLPIMFLVSLVTVAIYGFFVWLMARFLAKQLAGGRRLPYLKAVQVSIHSMVLPMLAGTALNFLGYDQLLTGWRYLLVFLLWTAVVLHQAHQHSPRSAIVTAAQTPSLATGHNQAKKPAVRRSTRTTTARKKV